MPQAMICFPAGGGQPDNTLPGSGGRPDNSLPNIPGYPDNGLPDGGGGVVDPGFGRPILIPDAPGQLPTLPPNVWPGLPIHPIKPGQPGHPSTLPIQPGGIWPPLPPSAGTDKLLVLVFISGVGARWTVIDPTLRPSTGLPGAAPK